MADLVSQWDTSGFGQVESGLQTRKIQADVIDATGAQIETDAIAGMRRAIGGDLRLSNWPRRGTSERAKVKRTGSGTSGTILFQPAGLWALVEEGARPHRIAGRTTRLRALVTAGRWRTGPFRHPGMAPLGKPITNAVKGLPATMETETQQQIERRF